MKGTTVKIERFNPGRADHVVGYFDADVVFENKVGFGLKGCSVTRGQDGRYWFNLPSIKVGERLGKPLFESQVRMFGEGAVELREEIVRMALAVRAEHDSGGVQP